MPWPTSMMRPPDPSQFKALEQLQHELWRFQDALAASAPDLAEITQLTIDLSAWARKLSLTAVAETGQVFGRIPSLPSGGQAMVPPFYETVRTEDRVEGTVKFGRWFLGESGAVHGGAIALLFDEIAGTLATASPAGRTRTASLKIDYRALTPIDRELAVGAWFERAEGRKRFLRGEIRDGETVCAEVEGLFVVLRPGTG